MRCNGKVNLREQEKLQDVFPTRSTGVFSLSLKRFSATNLEDIALILLVLIFKMFLYMFFFLDHQTL